MPTVRFHMTSALDPAALMDVLTDFGPTRPQQWPTIDADHFQVHSLGDTWAEVARHLPTVLAVEVLERT